MFPTLSTVARPARRAAGGLLLVASGLMGCSDLLGVPDDPTRIEDEDLRDARGADLLRRGALQSLSTAVAFGVSLSGILTDEFWQDDVFGEGPMVVALDQRESELYESGNVINAGSEGVAYHNLQILRQNAAQAAAKLKVHAPPAVRDAHVSQMIAMRGFATLRLAEYTCSGFPLHDVVDFTIHVSGPVATDQALERALADFDSAATLAADSARFRNFAQLGRARALLNLGRFGQAAAAASGIPTLFRYVAEYSTATGQLNWASIPFSFSGGVSDREGTNGLDYVSANDPRVQTVLIGLAGDGVTPRYGTGKYPTETTRIVIASGLEARLIEAEAALSASDPAWLSMLNDLRANQIVPAMSALADPGTADARLDLLYRERAFWLFATGSRLGDLRRLVRVYGRSAETVFPTGPYRLGGSYGSATAIPFTAAYETPFNPTITGCASR